MIYLSITVITYLSTVMAVNPWFYLLPYLPVSMCGGTCGLITGVFSYIADVTTKSDRPTRMAYLEASLYVGLLLGSISSSYLLSLTSATILFGIASTASFVGVLYVIVFVKESIQQDESVGKFVSRFTSIASTINPLTQTSSFFHRQNSKQFSTLALLLTWCKRALRDVKI